MSTPAEALPPLSRAEIALRNAVARPVLASLQENTFAQPIVLSHEAPDLYRPFPSRAALKASLYEFARTRGFAIVTGRSWPSRGVYQYVCKRSGTYDPSGKNGKATIVRSEHPSTQVRVRLSHKCSCPWGVEVRRFEPDEGEEYYAIVDVVNEHNHHGSSDWAFPEYRQLDPLGRARLQDCFKVDMSTQDIRELFRVTYPDTRTPTAIPALQSRTAQTFSRDECLRTPMRKATP